MTLKFFGEFPMWNPYDCKGVPMWDHPEGSASSPILLAMLKMDPLKTYHWWNVVHMVIGWVGMWLALTVKKCPRVMATRFRCVKIEKASPKKSVPW